MSPAKAVRRDAVAWGAAALGTAVLCAVFAPEIASAVHVWNSSTAYGHCWLVLPIVAWLLWERRGVLAGRPARPEPWVGMLAIPLLLVWVAADLLGIMEGRQLAAIGFVLLLLLAALGWRLWWALSAGLLYLVFLVPFGAFVTPTLQHFTADFIVAGLRAFDIPFEADTFKITIPEGTFYVAEACAGLRFLIASIAFGVLYAVTMFRSPWRRAAFIAVACVMPVVGNGIRGLGIVLLGHALGSAQAGAADHLIYGWVFFSTLIIVLALAGLPFRQVVDVAPDERPVPMSTARPGRLALACLPVVVLALAGPMLATRDTAGPQVASPAPLLAPDGCRTTGPVQVSGPTETEDLQCGPGSLRVIATALPPGSNPSRIVDSARMPALAVLADEIDAEAWTTPGPRVPWMLVHGGNPGLMAAYAVTLDGKQGVGGLQDRIRMVRDMLGRDRSRAPTAWTMILRAPGHDAGALLRTVLARLATAATPP